MSGRWVTRALREEVVQYLHNWQDRADVPLSLLIGWTGLTRGKFYRWQSDDKLVSVVPRKTPRRSYLLESEKRAIIQFYHDHHNDCVVGPKREGYRRLTYMMLDANIVAVSPSSVYRVLKQAGLIQPWNRKKSLKNKGFTQPLAPHEHWHIDTSYIKIGDVYYFLCCVLDGYSRLIVSWDLQPTMTGRDSQIVVQKGRENFPDARPRIISDNGSQFVCKEFKNFIAVSGMTHVRTSPYYPQSNGKIERLHKTLKGETIRVRIPLSYDDGRRMIAEFVEVYNTQRLHSAIGYITPSDCLAGKRDEIWSIRKEKLLRAKMDRRLANQESATTLGSDRDEG